jgi:hypothetical protein
MRYINSQLVATDVNMINRLAAGESANSHLSIVPFLEDSDTNKVLSVLHSQSGCYIGRQRVAIGAVQADTYPVGHCTHIVGTQIRTSTYKCVCVCVHPSRAVHSLRWVGRQRPRWSVVAVILVATRPFLVVRLACRTCPSQSE